MKTVLTLLCVAIIGYLALLVIVYNFQRNLLYFPQGQYFSPSEIGLDGFSEITYQTDDGLILTAWHHPAPADKKTIILFHGNGENLVNIAQILRVIAAHDFGVLAVEYRGYPGNTGTPTEADIYRDASAAITYARDEMHIAEANMILLGRSLGSGVAVQMATEYSPHALVLVSPYDSVAAIAHRQYWFFFAKHLIKDRFDSLAKAPNINAPTLIFHGSNDALIPLAHGKRLYDAIPSEKEFILLEGQHHNDVNFADIMAVLKERY